MRFEDFEYTDLQKIVNQKIDSEIVVGIETLGFQNVEDELRGVGEQFETPPTPAILMSTKDLAKIFVHTDNTTKGEWIRFFLCVYLGNGRVEFSRIDDTDFMAMVRYS